MLYSSLLEERMAETTESPTIAPQRKMSRRVALIHLRNTFLAALLTGVGGGNPPPQQIENPKRLNSPMTPFPSATPTHSSAPNYQETMNAVSDQNKQDILATAGVQGTPEVFKDELAKVEPWLLNRSTMLEAYDLTRKQPSVLMANGCFIHARDGIGIILTAGHVLKTLLSKSASDYPEFPSLLTYRYPQKVGESSLIFPDLTDHLGYFRYDDELDVGLLAVRVKTEYKNKIPPNVIAVPELADTNPGINTQWQFKPGQQFYTISYPPDVRKNNLGPGVIVGVEVLPDNHEPQKPLIRYGKVITRGNASEGMSGTPFGRDGKLIGVHSGITGAKDTVKISPLGPIFKEFADYAQESGWSEVANIIKQI